MSRLFGLAIGLVLAACAEDCKQGDPCDDDCPPGFAATCLVKGVCSCNPTGGPVPVGDGGLLGDGGPLADGTFVPPAECPAPEAGQLIVNEVMIDGLDDDTDEYIELVNTTDLALSLAGLKIRSNSGMSLNERVSFTSGCMPPRGAVALFKDGARWIYEPPIVPGAIVAVTKGFGFSNSADFTFLLEDAAGVALDTFNGPASLVDENFSVNRSPDGLPGAVVVRHDTLPEAAMRPSSPARCANGGTFAARCNDAPTPDAGPPPGDGGPPPGDGGPPPGDGGPPPGDGGPRPDGPPVVECQPIAPGAIRINEAMIDPAGDEGDGEFVELVNTTDGDLRLKGVSMYSLGSDGMPDLRFTLSAGILPARGAVAAYPTIEAWQFDPPTPEPAAKSAGRFQLPNTAEIAVTLTDCNQVEIDSFVGSAALITEGISVARSPDLAAGDAALVRHNAASMLTSSPGRCLNGGRFIEGCVAPPAMP